MRCMEREISSQRDLPSVFQVETRAKTFVDNVGNTANRAGDAFAIYMPRPPVWSMILGLISLQRDRMGGFDVFLIAGHHFPPLINCRPPAPRPGLRAWP